MLFCSVFIAHWWFTLQLYDEGDVDMNIDVNDREPSAELNVCTQKVK